MILTKEVEVRVNSRIVKYYESLGYDIPKRKASKSTYRQTGREFSYDLGNTFFVKVEDLPRKSLVHIEALCDICKDTITTPTYNDYCNAIEKYGNYACHNCGVIHTRESCINKYGVDHPTKTAGVQQKMKNTMVDRYGVEYASQSPEFKEKIIQTWVQKYGVDHPFKVQGIRDKAIKTMIERYGVPYSSQSQELRDKAIETWKQNLGVDSPCKSKEVREKQVQTLYKNSAQKCSKQQLYIFNLYNKDENLELNFPISYYNADICFVREKLVCEYDGGGHMLNVITGRETNDEFKRKEIIRNETMKREGFKQMHIISKKDLLPSDDILLQMLELAREYFSTTNHTWIEYNIDNSSMRNAEHKEGIHYEYGELRMIK